MDNNALLKLIVKRQAELWLKENPLLLNNQEKQKFLIGLQNYLENKTSAIDDEVYDFLIQRKLINAESREDVFMRYLIKKYGGLNGKNVLDVGAGRVCSLSKLIAEQGGKVTAMDINIRLKNEILIKSKITAVKKLFKCDEYAENLVGTNIENYNLIVGLEPCDATEHIIRQSLKYDKPFDVYLCAASHKGLNGDMFNTYKEWYTHLKNISKEVCIVERDGGFIATNNKDLVL